MQQSPAGAPLLLHLGLHLRHGPLQHLHRHPHGRIRRRKGIIYYYYYYYYYLLVLLNIFIAILIDAYCVAKVPSYLWFFFFFSLFYYYIIIIIISLLNFIKFSLLLFDY